ncbi:MAG: isopenicillin N synthase family oxygenase [Acidimicrobiales bacterium]|nr:isopenicillin N synthase family oxygenase [Acidimicrobiales bacterium]
MAGVPRIDVGALVDPRSSPDERRPVADAIDAACAEHGFFTVVGHGVDPGLLAALDREARAFFARSREDKARVAMVHGGRAWRGWFGVGDELTDGVPDRKEGLYFGTELGPDDPRVQAGLPLHGPNLFPDRPAGLRPAVLAYLDAATAVARGILRALAVGLGHDEHWFDATICADPVVLFRIFHYPAPDVGDVPTGPWGVAEHTDYGLLTVLHQDATGGLEVRGPGGWVEVPPEPGALVCNLGDMLAALSGGRYRSTPHRVHPPAEGGRLSAPLFLDPDWDAHVPGVDGTYGDHLTAKVARVFPVLSAALTPPRP